MNFSQLELLRAIQEKGSISAAAETVGFTQSAASRALSSLESELGVTLVNRTRSGGVLTEIGTHVLPRIYEILSNAEYIRQETAAQRGLSMGKLRIGSIPSMSARLLTQLVATFRHRYPGIETVVFEGGEAEIVGWIQQGIVDVGLVSHHQEDVQAFSIAQDEVLIVTSDRHRLAANSTVTVKELADEPFVMPKSGCLNLIKNLFQDEHLSLHLQLELSDVNTVLAMVREGLGITLIPALSLPDNMNDLHILHLEPPLFRQLSVIVNNAKSAAPATHAFIELTQNCPNLEEIRKL